MKNLYQNAEMEIVEFETEDVIATSTGLPAPKEDTDWSFGELF